MYYSQSGEDKLLNERFFKNKQKGFFIELGACDGILFSNTKFYEDQLDWTGVLIEPQPVFFEALIRNRPHSAHYNCAILDSEKPVLMNVRSWLDQGDPVGTLIDASFDYHHKQWHSERSTGIEVQTRHLDSILHEQDVTEIDLFSLDVEGSEFEVLQTMDWSIPIHVLIIEMIPENELKNRLCRDLLRQHNYTYDSTIAGNEIWLGAKELK